MTRLLVLLAALVILAAAGAGVAAGEAADTAAAAPFFSWDYWQEGGNASRSEVLRNFLLALIALGALIVGSTRALSAHRQASAANEQACTAQEGHFTERFSSAAEHLGSKELPVRLGGIYALWRLAQDSPKRDLISVIDILCAFVRDPPHPPVDRPEPDTDEGGPAVAKDEANATYKLRPDVQAVLKLIGNRDAVYRARLPDGYRLDLTGANLRGANLGGANLGSADLRDADLRGANLSDADLSEAYLMGANLRDADLTDADLTGALLTGANLTGAELTDANLTGAELWLALAFTQEQLDSACIIEGGPPPSLPEGEGLIPPLKVCSPLKR